MRIPKSCRTAAIFILLLRRAFAAPSPECDGKKDLVISADKDAAAFRSCKTLRRNLIIGFSAPETIDLTGVDTIDGSVTISIGNNTRTADALPKLKSQTLQGITGKLDIKGYGSLPPKVAGGLAIELPQLGKIGKFTCSGAFTPGQMRLLFGSASSTADGLGLSNFTGDIVLDLHNLNGNLEVVRNKGLTSVDLPALQRVKEFVITDNTNLDTISAANLVSARKLTVSTPGGNTKLSLPSLESVGDPSLTDEKVIHLGLLAGIHLPKLERSQGSIAIEGGSPQLSELDLPLLQTIVGSLTVRKSTNLTHINLPTLDIVAADLFVAENSKLTAFHANRLKTAGRIQIRGGNLTVVELASLEKVFGDFSVEAKAVDCAWFEQQKVVGKLNVKGAFRCSSGYVPPVVGGPDENQNGDGTGNGGGMTGGNGNGNGTTTEAGKGESLSKSATAGIAVGAVGGVLLVCFGVWMVERWRERKGRGHHDRIEKKGGGDDEPEKLRRDIEEGIPILNEMEAPMRVLEMHVGSPVAVGHGVEGDVRRVSELSS